MLSTELPISKLLDRSRRSCVTLGELKGGEVARPLFRKSFRELNHDARTDLLSFLSL